MPEMGTQTLADEGVQPDLPYHVRRKLAQKRLSFLVGPGLTLKCDTCGVTWRPETKGRQRLPKGYWICPNGCNLEFGEVEDYRSLRVLLVDDDKALCRSLAAILRKAGYRVVNVYNGADTLKAVEEGKFDAAIIDIRLPDIDGIELLNRIQKIDPVMGALMLSGVATLEDAVKALNYGADAFILKPVEPSDFLNRIGTVTGFKKLEKEIRKARARYNEVFAIIHEGN